METKKLDISIQNISKIEGHADLDVKVRKGKVQEVKFKLTENKRFFTAAIKGCSVGTLSQSVSRICGTCSIAHQICSINCIENALGIEVAPQTKLLKKLTMHGLMIRDHALHIYLFSLPDVFNKDSVLDFQGDEVQYLKDSFEIKRAGNNLTKVVAGRAVHSPFPQVGGFAKIPNNDELKALIPELKEARKRILRVIEVYFNSKVDYTRKTNFVALCGEFNYLDGPLKSSAGLNVSEKKYFDFLEKTAIPYSQATGYKFKGDTYLVGSLARLNLNKEALHKNTKKDCAKYLKVFPSFNVFHNNLAQAIEVVHSIDDSIDIITNTVFKQEEPIKIEYKDCEGVGVIEAPRGILFYKLKIDKEGNVKEGDIITPTQQNQINIELDIKALVQKSLNTLSKEQIQLEIEKLIRSYDPCISCATHFLKVNWL